MADNDTVLAAAAQWKGEPLALATVVSTWGSAPRPKGSHMIVHADGRFEGSVSGGCVEGDILDTAAQVIAGAPFQVKQYGVADASAWEVGLPCGGEISVMVQPVSAEGFDPELFDRIAEARDEGRALTVSTDLASGRSDLRPIETGEVFVNRYDPPRRLLIVGAVQIAQALAALATTLGIETVVIDPRARFLTEERFPRNDARRPLARRGDRGVSPRPGYRGGDLEPRHQDRRSRADRRAGWQRRLCRRARQPQEPCGAARAAGNRGRQRNEYRPNRRPRRAGHRRDRPIGNRSVDRRGDGRSVP